MTPAPIEEAEGPRCGVCNIADLEAALRGVMDALEWEVLPSGARQTTIPPPKPIMDAARKALGLPTQGPTVIIEARVPDAPDYEGLKQHGPRVNENPIPAPDAPAKDGE